MLPLLILSSVLAYANAATKCEELSNQALPDGLVGAFVPQCNADGSFKSEQCWGSTGYCWCVDEHGAEIPGTKVRGKPDCSKKAPSKCEQLSGQALPNGLVGAFVPECNADGSFKSEQCWGSTGYCWCVDEHGAEIPGTKVRGKPDCSKKVFADEATKCKKIRLEALIKGPLPGQFVPHCKDDGSFEPVQCLASTGYCWCVDENGERKDGSMVRFKRPEC